MTKLFSMFCLQLTIVACATTEETCSPGAPCASNLDAEVNANFQLLQTALAVSDSKIRHAGEGNATQLLDANPFTTKETGCQCYFDHSRKDCACCAQGACQCGEWAGPFAQMCVPCGHAEMCTFAPDRTDHECGTIRSIDWEDQENWPQELKRLGDKFAKKKKNRKFVKLTHAYGMPVLGISTFEDVSMRRSCYLVRYLFADNEWFRRWSYHSKFYAVGDQGGFCCPAQIGNQGMTCACDSGKYPVKGQGAPAHEMAHYFVSRVLAAMAQGNKLHIPDFVNVPGLDFTYKDSVFMEKNPPDTLTNFLVNSYWQDKARGSTKIGLKDADGLPYTDHYFIYTGMQFFINVNAGSGLEREAARQKQQANNPNLFNIMKEVWPCDNSYIGPCKDDAYGGKLQLAQTLKIGKADPSNPQKMICHDDLDKAEVPKNGVPAEAPTTPEDVCTTPKKCSKTINDKKEVWGKAKKIKTGDVEQWLNPSGNASDHGSEHAWWLRKCCAKTAKFA